MAEQTVWAERAPRIGLGAHRASVRMTPPPRAPRDVMPSAGTLMVRWIVLYSILICAVWAFLGSVPE